MVLSTVQVSTGGIAMYPLQIRGNNCILLPAQYQDFVDIYFHIFKQVSIRIKWAFWTPVVQCPSYPDQISSLFCFMIEQNYSSPFDILQVCELSWGPSDTMKTFSFGTFGLYTSLSWLFMKLTSVYWPPDMCQVWTFSKKIPKCFFLPSWNLLSSKIMQFLYSPGLLMPNARDPQDVEL